MIELLSELNAYRKDRGLPTLVVSRRLESLAQERATQECKEGDKLDHDEIPKPTGIYERYGEILGKSYAYPQELVTAWHNSLLHREQIEYPFYIRCGIGIYKNVVCVELGESKLLKLLDSIWNLIRRITCQ